MMTRKTIIKPSYATLLKRTGVVLSILGIISYAGFQMHNLITGPEILFTNNVPETTDKALLSLSGNALRAQHLQINDNPVTLDIEQNFSLPLLLLPGYNVLKIEATDRFGKTTERVLEIVRTPQPIAQNN